MGADNGWKRDFRVLYGRLQRVHPGTPRSFQSDVTRWRVIAEGVEDVMACVPRSERRTYVILAEVAAYAKHRRDVAESAAEVAELPPLFA